MEFTTKSDLCNSYLITEIPQEWDKNSFQFKMITKNKIRGLLECSEGIAEDDDILQYNVSGKKSLQQEFHEKEMQFYHMVSILQGMNAMLLQLKAYLLDEKYVLLTPNYIFLEEDTGQPYFIYYPVEEVNAIGKLRELADFFLEHGNHKEEQVVNISYLFYKQTKEAFFSLTGFLAIVEKEQAIQFQKNQTVIEQMEREDGAENLATLEHKDFELEESILEPTEMIDWEKNKSQKEIEKEKKVKKEKIKKDNGTKKYRLALSICSFVSASIVGAIILFCSLCYQLFIGLVALFIVLQVVGFLFLILFFNDKKQKLKNSDV